MSFEQQAQQYEIAIAILKYFQMVNIEIPSGEADITALASELEKIANYADVIIDQHNGEYSLGVGGSTSGASGELKNVQLQVTVRAFSNDGNNNS